MRILLLCYWAHGNCYYTAKFANALADAPKTEVHLVVPRNFITTILSPRVHVRKLLFNAPARIGFKGLLLTIIPQLVATFRIVRLIRPEWIHILWLHHVPVITGKCFTSARIAYTAHDPVLHAGESGLMRTLVHRCLVGRSQVCFTHGDANVNLFRYSFPGRPPIVSIPHGEFGFWERAVNSAQENIILFFGRIRPYKGLAVLLDAFMEISSSYPDIWLYICGEGDITTYQTRTLRMQRVKVINRFIGHDEIPSLFGRSLFICLPYLEATQSGVIPMAFALGRTCIATSVGALTDVAIHHYNSIIVPPGDVQALSGAMSYLLSHQEERERMENNAFISVGSADALSWKKTAETVIKTFRTIDS